MAAVPDGSSSQDGQRGCCKGGMDKSVSGVAQSPPTEVLSVFGGRALPGPMYVQCGSIELLPLRTLGTQLYMLQGRSPTMPALCGHKETRETYIRESRLLKRAPFPYIKVRVSL